MTTTEEAEQGEYERIVEIQTAKLREEFKKIDKDGNSKIDEHELMSFLESKGKSIDKESFLRLIRTLDIDSDGYLTIDEFISSYIRIMGELKITISQNEQKIREIEKEQIENEAKLEEHKNEKYNSEGLSLDSHINVHLDLVEINDSRLSSFDNIEAIISKGDFSKKFSSNQQEGNNFFFNKELKM